MLLIVLVRAEYLQLRLLPLALHLRILLAACYIVLIVMHLDFVNHFLGGINKGLTVLRVEDAWLGIFMRAKVLLLTIPNSDNSLRCYLGTEELLLSECSQVGVHLLLIVN